MINYWPLLGIALVVLGFALKFNPMLVVTVSAIATGLIAGMDPVEVISTFGKAFNDNRIIAIVWIVLPVIGLLERFGLQQRAAALIRGIEERDHRAAADPLSALPPDHRGDRAPFDRRPPADGAPAGRADGARRGGKAAWRIDRGRGGDGQSYSAATDNVGLFFGEDIFFAIGSIVLIQQTLVDLRLQPRPARTRAVGDPDRDRRLLHPQFPARCCSTAELARRGK